MDKQIRYLPDESGINKSNKVENESHKLKKQISNRIIVPTYGCFFSESVVVRDKFRKRILRYKKDYVFGGLRSNYTILTGKEISSFIIIINDEVSDNVTIDYQTYGGLPICNVETIIELLEMSLSNDTNIPFVKLLDLPNSYKPSFHYHDLGDVDKMEFLLFCLEKIRFSIMYSHQGLYQFLVGFDRLLQTLIDKALVEFEAELYRKMKQYTDAFKKSLFGVDLIENYSLMTSTDGSNIANGDHPSVIRDTEELYFSLKALSAYSSSIYELVTNIEETGLGAPHEYTVTPSSAKYEELPIGSGFVINQLGYFAADTNIEKFYPDRLEKDNSYFVKKLSSRETNLTPLFLYVGKDTTKAYVMALQRRAEEYVTKFTRIATTSDGNIVFDKLQEHIENYDNPHMDDKRDVDLAQVENLPLATMEDIICNIPARRYMTLKTLFAYMKRFKTGKKEVSEIYENYSLQNQTRRLQTIFSPCGTWKNDIDESKIDLCKVITTKAPIRWSVIPDVTEITIILEPVRWTISQDKSVVILPPVKSPYFTIDVNKTLSTSFNDPIIFTTKGHDLEHTVDGYLVIEKVSGDLDGDFIPPHVLGTNYYRTFNATDNEFELQTLLDGQYARDYKFVLVLRDSSTDVPLACSPVVKVVVEEVTTTTTTEPPVGEIEFLIVPNKTSVHEFDIVTFTVTPINLPAPKWYNVGIAGLEDTDTIDYKMSPNWVREDYGDGREKGMVIYPNTPFTFTIKMNTITFFSGPNVVNAFGLAVYPDYTAFDKPGYNIIDDKTHISGPVRVNRWPRAFFAGFKEDVIDDYKVTYNRNWPPPNDGVVGNFVYINSSSNENDFSLIEGSSGDADGYYLINRPPYMHMHPQDDRTVNLSLALRLFDVADPRDFSDITWGYYHNGLDTSDGDTNPCSAGWWDPSRGYNNFINHRVLATGGSKLSAITVSFNGILTYFGISNPGMDYLDSSLCTYGTRGYIVFFKSGVELGALEVRNSSRRSYGWDFDFGVFWIATKRDPNP